MEAGGDIFHMLFDQWNFWSAIVMILVSVWLFHHSLKYRSKDGKSRAETCDEFKPGEFPKENDNLTMELTWTILPFILIVYPTYVAWGPLDDVWSADPDAHEIGVTANQWFWDFDCMADNVEDNATFGQQNVAYNELGEVICEISTIDVEGETKPLLRVKADQSYAFIMTSNDVTHAPFFLDWGIKEDTQPGMETRLYHTPSLDEVGSALLMCTEYCGKQHSTMTAVVEVFQ